MPDTIRDRCISIRLERRTRDEPIERFRRRDAREQAEPIRQSVESLAAFHADALVYRRPELPDELDDRAQDCWEPLLAIADLAGGDWPARARAAAVAVSTGEEREDDSRGVRLLADIRDVFESNGTTRYPTADLIAELAKIEESPWGDWFGKPITPQAIGKLLKPYRIKTMPIRAEGEVHRGYKLEQFKDVFARVLGVTGRYSVTSQSGSGIARNTDVTLEGSQGVTALQGVTDEAANHAGSNARNTCNTLGAERKLLPPQPGEPGYLLFTDVAYQNDHITYAELLKLQKGDRRERRGRDRLQEPPPLSDDEVDGIAATLEEESAA